jgi:hypothetical protein
MIRDCVECGREFEAKGAWMRRCWDCWRERKDQEVYDRGYAAGLRAGRNGHGQRNGHGLDSELLRALVTLCHPDRHPPERFELANRTTATLLGLLKDAR